jgi:hypothetical protein
LFLSLIIEYGSFSWSYKYSCDISKSYPFYKFFFGLRFFYSSAANNYFVDFDVAGFDCCDAGNCCCYYYGFNYSVISNFYEYTDGDRESIDSSYIYDYGSNSLS